MMSRCTVHRDSNHVAPHRFTVSPSHQVKCCAMGVHLQWLDWDEPCLPRAARWLVDRAAGEMNLPLIDLQHITCVLPGARAGRLLLGQLLREAQQRAGQLIPPQIHTPGSLLLSLIADQPVASDAEMELAWAAALRRADRDTIKPLVPVAPDADDALAWQSLAKTVAGLHDDLAGACRQFADAADLAERLELFGEGDRWRALTSIHHLYRKELELVGLRDRHEAIEAALAHAPLQRFSASPMQEIILIAVPELNAIQRRFIAWAGERISVLVHAPRELADCFDDLGCVIPERWQDAMISLDKDQIVSADRPSDQAQHALRTIANFNGRYSAGEITIGLGDPALSPVIEHAAQWAGLSVRNAAGLSLRHTPPCRALEAIGDYLRDPRFATFAAMLRHPDIERWIWNRTRDADLGVRDWLSLLDEYFQQHLDERFTGHWLGDEKTVARLTAVHRAIIHLLRDLRITEHTSDRHLSNVHRQSFSDWAQPLLNVLTELYREADDARRLPGNALRISASREIRDVMEQLCAAPAGLQAKVDAADAIALLLQEISDASLPQPDEPDAIEMLGWLELHLDLAPALIITGVNEGHIPRSAMSDPFLPDSLRQKLGLPCNATRYARDAYLLQAMLNSREHVTLIAGRRSDRGEALTPSRLLLACADHELVRRVKHLCDEKTAAASGAPIGLAGRAAGASRFVVPALPQPLPALESMRITDFRAYLACPYRFALARLLRLEAFDDSARELDRLQFGSLAHEVLCALGQEQEISASDDASKIERFLIGELRKRVPMRFGPSPAAAVRVQIARMELRLAAFAGLQANLCREGWRIRFCELPFSHEARETASVAGGESNTPATSGGVNVALDVPGQPPMPLRGKIDRIDFNERTGAWRIIDYKTGETAESPHKAHIGRESCDELAAEDWQDLQLPLYHYLATHSPHNIRGEIQLAYISLPRQLDGIALRAAQWNDDHLAIALDVAREIVRNIRAGDFRIKRDFTGFDDFARICQTTAYIDDEQTVEVET